jgi:hypothetical protein
MNGHAFILSKFNAQFISPFVSRALLSDAIIREMTTVHPAAEWFHFISLLADGESIVVPTSQIRLFSLLCSYLGNTELVSLLFAQEEV